MKNTLQLKSGFAEVFGTELVVGKKYDFTCGSKIAVFTWQGCTLELLGKPEVSYVARETPMSIYLNCHIAMETMREAAEREDSRGPVVMVVGPNDVGKSTLCKILLNYAAKVNRRPIYVDLDVGQGHISIPGTIGALLVERPSSLTDGFSQQAPLVFHFGHKSPLDNVYLFNLLVLRLAEVCLDRFDASKKAKSSGTVINTCGCIKGDGYKMLTHAAKTFEVDTILVLDQERLYNELVRDMPDFVKVIFLPKSGGVVERTKAQRTEACYQVIKEYFYGSRIPLYPHSFEVRWSEAKLFKIGVPVLPSSCLPAGMKSGDNFFTKLVPLAPAPNLLHHVFSVSFADSPEDDVVQTNIAGFVCV